MAIESPSWLLGAGALALADYVGWQMTYLAMAAVMVAGVHCCLTQPRPHVGRQCSQESEGSSRGTRWRSSFPGPTALGFLAVIVLYKLGDAFASALQTAFLIGGLGFSAATDVGAVKGLGIFATLIGRFCRRTPDDQVWACTVVC